MKRPVDKSAFNDWQALLKHVSDSQIKIKWELKLSGRGLSSHWFQSLLLQGSHPKGVHRHCSLMCAQRFGSVLGLN